MNQLDDLQGPITREVDEVAEEFLMHYGMPRRSGRYPWGSGENPGQHGSGNFYTRVQALKKNGWKDTPENIMKEFGLTTTQYRTQYANAKDEYKSYEYARIMSLKKDGLGATEIGKIMGLSEGTVRSKMNSQSEAKRNQAKETAEFIKEQIKSKGLIDVGTGVERELNISKEKLNQALKILQEEGYVVNSGRIEQVTNRGKWTTQKVIGPPGTETKDIYDLENVHSLKEYISRDGGDTYERKFTYPESLDSKRLKIRYNEEGGLEKDGVIELRRGVDDLSLGESRYSQVRILVDKTHYLKGMAVYSDDMPDGVDVIFNTNKKKGTAMMDVLKPIKNDPDNPFGSLIKDAEQGGQYWYTDSKTGKKKLGLINKRADEGDWDEWADALPSQFLSKQSKTLAQKQLDLAKSYKLAEFDEYRSLTNPTIKKYLLNKFADECDSAAVDLKAASLPGQKYHVIIPVNSLRDDEVYAPNYANGTKLALIRYPHGGTFEIPICTVNNKHEKAKKLLGTDVIDAVGINSKVAERLSGADFDGDTVMCIPTHDPKGKVKITSTQKLQGLEGFDPKTAYGPDTYKDKPNVKIMGKKLTQTEMGKISNLITDMTLAGASDDEKAAAVRHSMVVIDANKHKLDYKQSEVDNNIKALTQKYQPKFNEDGDVIGYGGASTIISRSKGQVSVVKRQGSPIVNLKGSKDYDPTKPEGSLIYKKADDAEYSYTKVNKKTGATTVVTKTRTQKSTKMAETDDATTLVSNARHPMELIYAQYANSMKDLANRARIEAANTGKIATTLSAKKAYQGEVDSLNQKLDNALKNNPREREAQRRANVEVEQKKAAYLDNTGEKMDAGDVKKASQQAISKYRNEVGSVSRRERNIEITDKEWEAIQAGAVSENTLTKILNNTDVDALRQRATPRTSSTLSTAQINRIKAMSESNFTLAEIANKMNVSTSTISKYLKGDN